MIKENQNLKESFNGPLWTDQYQDILTKENIGESFNTLTVSKEEYNIGAKIYNLLILLDNCKIFGYRSYNSI